RKMLKTLVSALTLAAFLTGCAVTVPVNATSNAVGGKVGEAETTQILGFFPDGGDASIRSAAKNGGISEISTVDFKKSAVFLGLVYKYTTIVTGE
ncbi:MAG: TRL domain-containing protein, partial [Fibrobacterota bacterium]